MAISTLYVPVEDSLIAESARVFEGLGIDTSIAVRMFLKRVVLENGIPFRMTLPKESYQAERGYRAMLEMGEEAAKRGISELSLDEINAEIDASRIERGMSAG